MEDGFLMGRVTVDSNGMIHVMPEPPADMMIPVQCVCGSVYDLAAVEVTARYLDCSVWTTPCCNRKGVDDRPEGWGGRRLYTHLIRR